MTALAEAGANCTTLWCDYVHTQFDPAHLLSELGFTVVSDVLLVGLLWGKFIKPRVTRSVHTQIDKEHGYTHRDRSKVPHKRRSTN